MFAQLTLFRPSIKNLTKRSMVHIRLKVGYKQDFSLEVDELDEQLIFDVGTLFVLV